MMSMMAAIQSLTSPKWVAPSSSKCAHVAPHKKNSPYPHATDGFARTFIVVFLSLLPRSPSHLPQEPGDHSPAWRRRIPVAHFPSHQPRNPASPISTATTIARSTGRSDVLCSRRRRFPLAANCNPLRQGDGLVSISRQFRDARLPRCELPAVRVKPRPQFLHPLLPVALVLLCTASVRGRAIGFAQLCERSRRLRAFRGRGG